MKPLILLLSAVVLACTSASPPAAPQPIAAPAVDEQTRHTISQLEAAVAQQPANQTYVYLLAMYYDRAHDADNVVKWLRRLDQLGWSHGVPAHDFRNTRSDAFREIVAKLEIREPSVRNARRAFTLSNQRDLIPEGITYDPRDDVFYLTSIYHRKVVRVDRQGRTRDFAADPSMLAGLGTHVDAARRVLWVATTALPEMRGFTPELEGRSALFALDLRDGRVLRRIEFGSKEEPSLLNDFVILADGTLLVTDTTGGRVMRLAPEANALELWLGDFRFPNGIALSADGQHVYVADFRGITRVAVAERSRQKIEATAMLSGIDGLALHNGALIGIQNAIGKARVVRIGTDSGRVEVLEAKNPLFELPTTGVVIGDELWFIANPGLRSFDDKKIWPKEKLQDPVMLRLPLATR
jgi:sugar lactone lactonase YvrE